MDAYSLVKTIHIISSTILFGTGLGTAFFFWRANSTADIRGRLTVARATVLGDWLFTTPAIVVQPATGAWLIVRSGVAWDAPWLVGAYGLYLLAGACWLPVVAIQIRMKRMLEQAERGAPFDEVAYRRLFRIWFLLGWPAFGGLVAVFFLMVAKPTW